jgi:hypothetical protein
MGRTRLFDEAVILFDAVVQILALPNADRLQSVPRSVPQAVCRIAGRDGFLVGLAAVDDDAAGTAVPLERLGQEALRRRQVAVFAEIELDRVTKAVDGALPLRTSEVPRVFRAPREMASTDRSSPTRFFGSVEIDMVRPVKSFDTILNAVIMELQRRQLRFKADSTGFE